MFQVFPCGGFPEGRQVLSFNNKMFQGRKGFTLIEVLIVIAIIGLLASVVLVGMGPFRARGRDARRIADLREVQNALELYYTKDNSYPVGSAWGELQNRLISAVIGISSVSNDPISGWNYAYCKTGNESYVLAAYLEDTNNSALKQTATFPCVPQLIGTGMPSDPSTCSTATNITNKYCLVF